MTNPKSRMFAAVVGALSLGAAAAWAVEPTQTDAKIQELQAKVAALEAKQAANTKDLAATVDAVLRDAERRSQLLANGGEMGAGYENGFYIRKGNDWVLRPSVLFQFWNVTDFRQEVVGSGGEEDDRLDNGFEVHRLKFALEGTAMKDITYCFIWQTSSSDSTLSLLDAWAKYMFADDWGLQIGQFKDPVNKEFLTGDQYLMAAERSLMNQLLGGGFVGYTQGVGLVYGGQNPKNPWNAIVAFTDGIGQGNTSFTEKTGLFNTPMDGNYPLPGEFDFGVAGRVEYLAFGDWKDYRDFSAQGNKQDLLVLGMGGDWSQSGDGDSFVGALDAQWENASGLGIYGAGLVRYLNTDMSSAADDSTDWGLLAQVSYTLDPQWEVFGRYDITFMDDEAALIGGTEDNYQEITVGLNYYLKAAADHRAKFTVDLTWLPTGAPNSNYFDATAIGAQDENDGSNEFMLRAQFQLLI